MKKFKTIKKILSACIASAMMFSFSTLHTSAASTTWYSQLSSSSGSTWSSTKLDKLYFPNLTYCTDCGSTTLYKCRHTPFYTTSSYTPANNQLNKGHMNKWGCNMCSIAMIFKNMGATTKNSRYDFRNGTSKKQSADPFTVSMANMGWPSVAYSSADKVYNITSYTTSGGPCYTFWATAAGEFGKSAYKVDFKNLTAKQKADTIAYYLDKNPEGILVRVGNTHSLVFTDTTHPVPTNPAAKSASYIPEPILLTQENESAIAYEEYLASENAVMSRAVTTTTYDSKFTCYDPGTTQSTKGNGVTYNNSYSAGVYGGIDNVNFIYYFD